MVHGLPQKPQGQGAAGPSRPPAQQQNRQVRQPVQPQYQPQFQYPYQQAQPSGYYPYAAQQSGGYNPYAAYYQQAAQQYPYGYEYQAITTPEGYTYSATHQNQTQATQAQTYNEPPNKRSRPNPGDAAGSAAPVISVKPWRNCSHPGCKFVGSGEDVEVHEGDRHLIFPNGRRVERSEEEEKWASHKGPPPPIEGTGIVLASDEDIAKWIAERKAKWPSAKRLAERNEEREAAIARGENPDKRNGRGRGGANGGKRNNPAAAAEDWGRPIPEAGNGQSSRGSGRGRGHDRGRGRGRGRGGGGGGGDTQDRGYAGRQAHLATGESVPVGRPKPELRHQPLVAQTTVPDIKPGTALVGYTSDASADKDNVASESESSSDSSSSSDEDEEPVKGKSADAGSEKQSAAVCRFFAKTGRCKMGQKCRFLHPDNVKPQDAPRPPKPQGPKQQQAKKTNPFERPSMLGALLANPIQKTLSQLTQTIRFLVANDMLRGVELNPGDAEAQQKERSRISVVEDRGDGEVVLEGIKLEQS